MADTPDSSPNAKYYDGRYGLASLVGASAAGGISLDGESLLLPDTVTGRDFDDVSSINSSVIGRPVRPTTATTTRETVSATTYSKGTKHTEESTFKKNSTASAEQSSSGGCCCCCLPLWIRRAPLWLKIVFSISVALLLLAIVLVAVGLALAMGGTSTGGTAQESARDGGFSNEFPTRTAAPVSDTTTPTSSPVTSSTSTTTTGTKPTVATTDPTAAATTPAPSTRQPTLQPSQNPSTAPTEPLDDDILVFYAMAGRFQNSIRTQALENLPRLPRRGGTSFLLHMGDWNSRRDGCPESVFEDVRDDFKESSIPVYFVMGDNEYNGTFVFFQ